MLSFSYWRGKKGHEVDMISDKEGTLIPFEVKYRSQATGAGELKGLKEFCSGRDVERAYVVTKDILDFGVMDLPGLVRPVRVLKIPSPLACYWLGQMELARSDQEAE